MCDASVVAVRKVIEPPGVLRLASRTPRSDSCKRLIHVPFVCFVDFVVKPNSVSPIAIISRARALA